MTRAAVHRRAGMTLIELLVVLMIVGLLSAAAVPLLVGNRDKKSVRNAADAAESVFSHVATKAMSAPNGAAAWLETGTSGAGNGVAVTSIAFARVPSAVCGTTTIAPDATNPATDAVVLLSLSPSLAADLPAPIEFAGVAGMFTATSTTAVTGIDTSVSGVMNRTSRNSAAPRASTSAVPYTLHLPPRPSSLAATTPLAGGVAIDMSASQIGLTTVTSLSAVKRLAVEYSRTGLPIAAWLSTGHTGGSWTRIPITASTPIVLAIGMRSQAGESWVQQPTEDTPGASWQSPFARWLLIDPRNGGASVIEAGSTAGAQSQTAAFALSLAPVVEEFANTRKGG